MEMLTRWPGEWMAGWVETMTGVARDETSHLARATRLLTRRGGRLGRGHTNPYARALRQLVRTGGRHEIEDRLLVSALIELRSCERFSVLANVTYEVTRDEELAAFYKALWTSEMGHYAVFLRLALKLGDRAATHERWEHLLDAEAHILAAQSRGPRMHSGF
jgi:tRNA-(ms[2]io[6]A)-hydroxylase